MDRIGAPKSHRIFLSIRNPANAHFAISFTLLATISAKGN
jgi:hypothetical protein